MINIDNVLYKKVIKRSITADEKKTDQNSIQIKIRIRFTLNHELILTLNITDHNSWNWILYKHIIKRDLNSIRIKRKK